MKINKNFKINIEVFSLNTDYCSMYCEFLGEFKGKFYCQLPTKIGEKSELDTDVMPGIIKIRDNEYPKIFNTEMKNIEGIMIFPVRTITCKTFCCEE